MEQVREASPALIGMELSRRTISPIARVYVAGWARNDAKLTAKSGRRYTDECTAEDSCKEVKRRVKKLFLIFLK